jgi:peptidyl-prolyl cis-trans isomerase C
MPPEFDVCFQLKKGQISDVIETQYGFHIFKLVEKRDSGNTPFTEVERAIELKLKRAAVERAQTAYLDRLRQKAGVKIIDAEVEKVM